MDTPILAFVSNSIINILMLLILLYLIYHNTIMPASKTKAYVVAVLLTIIVILAEVATSVFDLLGAAYRAANICANIVGFSVSACIPIVLAVVFNQSLVRFIKYIALPAIANFVLTVASAWTGWIFFISIENQYSRGPFFGVYIMTYIFGLIVLMLSNYHQSKQFEDTERGFLMMLYAIFFIGTTVQVVFPFIHSSWHAITLVLVMYYLFQRELQFKYDVLTNLLNRQSFENKLHSLRGKDHVGIILLDIDKFKQVNDSYGHTKGDDCLKTAACIVKSSFEEIGQCYRIGGDELCVLAQDTSQDAIERCIKTMLEAVRKAKEADPLLPTISYGYSIYHKDQQQDILQAFQEADKKMYRFKNKVSIL